MSGVVRSRRSFRRGNHFTIWGSKSLETSIDRVVRDQMSPVVFPVSFEELDATIDFRHLAEGERCAGNGYDVTAMEVRHPGGARLDTAFPSPGRKRRWWPVSDNELGVSTEKFSTPSGWKEKFVEFAGGTRCWCTTRRTRPKKPRSSSRLGTLDAVQRVPSCAGPRVETLVLFHHEPASQRRRAGPARPRNAGRS